eukprot:CAMPEP_0181181026 /NCGR_PEP_ID=MMETSP1096-20121128/7119_1 /TAXON_ID=156174 ORGANISM="Chrysochromulina ericina, Strain CCMP281" /NCGR_SAMPLE_ID=MMETSP1096 /ASSEMBLY_ACC=CAM_ASM_000453 /LENGTH=64 /DNA_ID=CAMNT_0023269505 /DNA_START=3 /DNA_END=197 /DNA_ORIENTATION=+
MYPNLPVAEQGKMDIASGVPGAARKIESRAVSELGMQLTPYQQTLKASVDSMISHKVIAISSAA